MAIPASKIVSVIPRLIQAGGTELEISGLLLTKNTIMPFPYVYTFDSKNAVKDYFGVDSEEYALAEKYFLGYNNSFRKPRRIHYARRANEPLAAFLQGAAISATLADFKAITAGAFTISIDGNSVSASNVDLSAATSLSGVAEILTTYTTGAVVSYSSLTGGFTVTSATTGADSSIGYLNGEGDLVTMLMLGESDGAVISEGTGALTASANMDSVINQTKNFVTFSTTYLAETEEALSFANWATNQDSEYLYVLWSQDEALKSQVDTTSIAQKILDANYGATTGVFGSTEYAVFIMGTAASIDWDRRNGAITFAFKEQDGLAATVTDGNVADILLGKRFNYYGRHATRADSFIFLYDGCMFGEWRFIDAYINGIWLRNALQLSLLTGIKQSPRTPYTRGGYTLIRAWCADPIERALNNGVIEPGVGLSNSQKAELMQEAGVDISTDLYTKGYYLQVEDPGAQARVNRDSPVIALWYTYGGSIHRLEVPATAVL